MTTTKKKKVKVNYKRIVIKLLLSFVYLAIIGILCYSAFSIFTEERKTVKWNEVEKTSQYTYLEITQMSEAFAKIGNKQIHYVMEKENSGAWHTYLIAINEKDYAKYKNIIDFTYERIPTKSDNIKVYGYPVKITKKIKSLAIQNITKFVPVENEIKITDANFEQYLTDTYLDTTIEKVDSFNYYVLILLLGAFIVFIIFIYTIFEKDKTQIKSNNSKKKQSNKKKNQTKEKQTKKSTSNKKKGEKIEKQKSSTNTKKQEKVVDKKEVEESKKDSKTNHKEKKKDQDKNTTKKKEETKKESKTNHETNKNVQDKNTTKKKEEDIEII